MTEANIRGRPGEKSDETELRGLPLLAYMEKKDARGGGGGAHGKAEC